MTPEQAVNELYQHLRRAPQPADMHEHFLKCAQIVIKRLHELDALQAEAKPQTEEPAKNE